ncbi:MAG: MBL fold metallo-hydrolase, partial [Chlamydiia bacterium]|nr:MBL fold metallo-hydrolase [Chlamydiia bacterium]
LYFGSKNTKILIDAGLSGLATKTRLSEIGVNLEEIEAIVITHEHTDHISGLKTLALRYGIPVYANAETAKGIYAALGECPSFKIFTTGEGFSIGDIHLHPFSIQHDTADPVAFTLHTDNIKVGICTDLGFATTLVRSHLRECDYLHIEANHEPSMVHACARPQIYKQRVLGRSGHLSNAECADLLHEVLSKRLKHIHLAHLSQECNAEVTALETIRKKIGVEVEITIAPQYKIGKPIHFFSEL